MADESRCRFTGGGRLNARFTYCDYEETEREIAFRLFNSDLSYTHPRNQGNFTELDPQPIVGIYSPDLTW